MRMLLAFSTLAFLLAGCAGDSGGAAKLSFDDTGAGTHEDEAKGCDDDGTLTGSGMIDDGSLLITVSDGSGNEVFSREYTDEVDLEAEALEGASGDWMLTATRTPDDLVGDSFQGDYVFNLSC